MILKLQLPKQHHCSRFTAGHTVKGSVPTLNELVNTITRLTDSALDYFYKSEEEFRSSEVGSGRFSVKVHEFEEEVEVKIVLELGEHSWYKARKTS